MTDLTQSEYLKVELEDIVEEPDKAFSIDLKDKEIKNSEDIPMSKDSKKIFLSLLLSLGVT